ncbi:MAG TPA: wax ester/triacylglycerol synthase family O-acyltransferase [Terriglobales bacterium]
MTTDSHDHESLSLGDSLFLYLEREGMPLNVASISVFEGVIPFAAFSRFIVSKLPFVPRYRQRIAVPPLNIGLPAWENDPHFDPRNHIRQVTLKRGTDAEFKTACANILSANMDRSRPLWDLTLVRGLQGNRTGVITRIHHCLADGISGIGLMNVLMDQSPVVPRLSKHPSLPALPPPAPPALLDSFLEACFSGVQRVLTAQSELLAIAERLVASAGAKPEQENGEAQAAAASDPPDPLIDQLSRLVLDVARPVERLPFNVICRGPQKFYWTEIPMAEIKAVKQACGATVNDVALAAMASAVRRYAKLHGVRVKGRALRIVVPVSVRGKGDVSELGNRITFLPVTLSLDIKSPRKLLIAVREQMTLLKNARLAELVGFAGTLLGTIPSPLQALLGPLISQLPISLCNLIFTNVRGPATPLYLLGHQMLACYPYVPIGGEMGMNCAVLTYNGTAYFGFTGDEHAIPDLQQFEKLLNQSFTELRKRLAGPEPRQKRAPAGKEAAAEAPTLPPAAAPAEPRAAAAVA